MTTYSNLGIKLMETGAESGTWGASTNTNFEYFDTAIVGFISIALSLPGTSSTPNTLDVADFAESNGRNRLIHFTSPSDLASSAYIKITPDDFKGYYFIRNSLLGGRSLILFQGIFDNNRAYTIPNGKDAVVRCDGLGITASVINVYNNIYNNSISTNTFTTNTFTTTNLNANNITATTKFIGPGTGLTGTANSLTVNYTNSATTATTTNSSGITLTAENVTHYPTWVSGTSGGLPLKVSNSKLNVNPSIGRINLVNIVTDSVTNSGGSASSDLKATNITVTEATPTFTGTGAIKIPTGTDAQRPSGPSLGMIRYNTTTASYEVYTVSGWQALALGSVPSGGGLGINQQWRNMTGSRAVNTLYTNDKGAPIQIIISATTNIFTKANVYTGEQYPTEDNPNTSGYILVQLSVTNYSASYYDPNSKQFFYDSKPSCWSTIVPYKVNNSGAPICQYKVTPVGNSTITITSWWELW